MEAMTLRPELALLLSRTHQGAAADAAAVDLLESRIGSTLPDDYREFLFEANGCQGPVGDAYLQLWSVQEIVALNESYAVAEFVPGSL
jgi:hypothetical protein